MARHLRVEFPGAIYHVTCRMIGDGRLDRSRLFVDDRVGEVRLAAPAVRFGTDVEGAVALGCGLTPAVLKLIPFHGRRVGYLGKCLGEADALAMLGSASQQIQRFQRRDLL